MNTGKVEQIKLHIFSYNSRQELNHKQNFLHGKKFKMYKFRIL